MKKFDVIVIGAGPAGLFAAINAAQSDSAARVLVLEKKAAPGTKLLMAGSGKCNVTHIGRIEDFFKKYADKKNFITPALKSFTNSDLIDFLKSRGLGVIVDKNGKVFPETESARDVLDLLLRELKSYKIEIHGNDPVVKVEKIDDEFIIHTSGAVYSASNVIIATGGKSYPTTGSTGDGYAFAKFFGHSIIPPKPALTPVFINNFEFAEISGVSLKDCEVYLYRGDKKLKENIGDVGFTHFGLSGPGIIDFSRYINPGDIIKINLIGMKPDFFKDEFIDAVTLAGKTLLKKHLKKYDIAESLIKCVLTKLNLSGAEQIANVTKTTRNLLAEYFCEHPFIVQRLGDYNIAMATAGGVDLKEVNSKTMESKLVAGLYFAGEVLDIDGDTGGYNIQAAFSTGAMAGKSAVK